MLFEQLATNDPLVCQILQYAAFLDPDFINIKIFQELFKLDANSLQKALVKLEKLSLASIEHNDDIVGLKIHRLV